MKSAPEAIFQDQVVRMARMASWIVWHEYPQKFPSGRHGSRDKGKPDLTLISRIGRGIIFAELKTDTGKLTPEQIEAGEAIVKSGGEYYVWRPRDLQDIAKRLGTTHRKYWLATFAGPADLDDPDEATPGA